MTPPKQAAAFLGTLHPVSHSVVPWLTRHLGEPAFRFLGMRRGSGEPKLAGVRHILVVRLDEVGDVVMTGPFLRELRANALQARITLVVKASVANLVALCPYVDEVLTFEWRARGPARALRLHLRALRLARRALWTRGVDLAIVPRWDVDWYHGAFVAYLSGARQRVGYSVGVAQRKQRLTPGYDRLFTRVLDDTPAPHEVERNLEVIRRLGGTVGSVALEAWPGPDDEAFARRILAAHGLSQDRSLIALGIGKRDRKRRWPLECFAELGAALVRDHGARLVVFGEAAEREMADELQRALPEAVVNLVGQTTLRQTVALLERCALYVGNDYGVKHLAAAADVPVVEINAYPVDAPPAHPDSPCHFAPWGVPHVVLQPAKPRPPCLGACQSTEPHCIREVTVEQARAAAAQLLRQSAGPAAGVRPSASAPQASGAGARRADGSPLVSVVTPSFNQAAFLEETILSVVNQQYSNLEYLVFDGGSTDGSLDVIRRHEARISYWVSQPDAGQADAINQGFARARGEILAWLNSDDAYEPGAVAAAVKAFRAHPEADALYGDCAYVDDAGTVLTVFRGEPFSLAGYLTTEGYIHQPTVFFRRRVIERVGLLDPGFHLCLDYEYWLRIGVACRWLYVPRIMARFRLHPQGKTHARSTEFLLERLRCLDRVFSDPRIPAEASRKKRRAYAVAYLSGGERAYECGRTGEARARLLRSLRWDPNPFRPKTVKAMLLLGDLLTGLRIGKRLVDRHARDRARRRRSRISEDIQ